MSYSQQRNALLQQKPEYVLKRADDLIATALGNNADREKRLALEQLHAHISSRGKKSQSSMFSKIYETVMKRHLELCVDLKDDRTAKDGLHQYRNLCQTVDPASLETVVVHLMDLAEMKAQAARTKADKVALAAAAKVSDLEQEETPESIMLSSMTEEGYRDRTDREVVVPWLKFLWEIYRAVLDLLHKNPQLERVYHRTCEKAFNFCKTFNRTLEFRRLCDMLRAHLISLQKVSTAPARVERRPWEWTQEGIELHLQTRFAQLEVASSLELWNEGFRTVEEIYSIMQIGGKKTKPRVMAQYYEKLTRIFFVSDNHLFHAYCWYRYYTLTVESKPNLPAQERKILASSVLLSALSIPSIKETGIMDPNTIPVILDDEEIAHEKNQRMAMLLDFQANPTRQALLQDIVNKGILNDVLPGLADLYSDLETKFHPLSLAKNISGAIAEIKKVPQLAHYAVPLQRVAVLRVVLQLSRVYCSVGVDFVRGLLAPLSDVPYNQVERVMVDGVSRKQLQLRIDHAAGCLRFGSLIASSTVVETHVATFGATLGRLADTSVTTLGGAELQQSKADARRAYLAKVAAAVEDEFAALQERKRLIELRKEGLERQHAIQAERTRISVEEQEARRRVAETKRLEEEARQREEENRKKAEEKLSILKLQKDLAKYSITMDEQELAGLDSMARLAIIRDAKAREQASKDEAGRRVNEQARKLDHITRALRIEGSELIGKRYAEQVEQDRIAHEEAWKASEKQRRDQHAVELLEKARMARFQSHRAAFDQPLIEEQKEAFEKSDIKRVEKALLDLRQKRIARARQRYNDEIEREREERELEEERREKEERERERLERETADKLRQQREADEAAERAIFEAAQKAKRDEERAARLASSAPPSSADAPQGAGAGGGWQSSRREGAGAAASGPATGGSGLARFAAAGGSGGGWNSNARSAAASAEPAPEGGGRWGSLGGDRPARGEGGFGGDRPARGEGGFGGDRPRGEGGRSEGGFGGARRDEGGPRSGFGSGGDRPPRGEGGFGGDRPPRGEGGFGGDRPRGEGGFGGDRPPRGEGGFGGRGEGGFGGARRDDGGRGQGGEGDWGRRPRSELPPSRPTAPAADSDAGGSWRKK